MVVWCMCFLRFLSLAGRGEGGLLRFSNAFIECLWVPPHILGEMVMSGLTFHPVTFVGFVKTN